MSVNVNEMLYSHESLRKCVKLRLEQKILRPLSEKNALINVNNTQNTYSLTDCVPAVICLRAGIGTGTTV